MSEPPTISVVMAVYNGAAGLSETIESLRRQTYRDFELIIIDDASTDGTWDYLHQLDFPRLRVHRHTTNKGQTASLNLALEMAQGCYVARHDAEDISAPDRFEKQIAFLESYPDVALLGSQIDWIDKVGDPVRHFEYPLDHETIVKRLASKNSFGHGAVMIRREALLEMGFYRQAFRLAQDYDLWLRLADQYRLANLAETLYKMRFSARMASVTRNAEQAAYAKLARQLAEERARYGQEKTDVDQAAAAIAARYKHMNPLARQIERATNYINWAERLLWWGEPSAKYAWPMWVYALTTWPLHPRVWKFVARQVMRSTSMNKERL